MAIHPDISGKRIWPWSTGAIDRGWEGTTADMIGSARRRRAFVDSVQSRAWAFRAFRLNFDWMAVNRMPKRQILPLPRPIWIDRIARQFRVSDLPSPAIRRDPRDRRESDERRVRAG
jgi:hypothetical protein